MSIQLDALSNLRPGAKFAIVDGSYDKIEWLDENQTIPTKAEFDAEVARLEQEIINKQYQRDRATAYPNITDQLDMLYHDIKAGTLDTGAWIQAIEAVKTEYPKP